MNNIAQLNTEKHKNLRVLTERSAALGDTLMYCQTFAQELRYVQAQYPILFTKAPDSDYIYPIALFGFERGENLYLSEPGWSARYIPLMVQRQPFYIGLSQAEPKQEAERVIHIDLSHPRVSITEGQALFDEWGNNTEFLDKVSAILDTIHRWNEFNQKFMDRLQQENLLEPMNLDITLKDGSTGQLLGFYGIHEEKFQALSKDVLFEFKEAGYLEPIYMALASITNIAALAERKSDRLQL